MKKKSILLFAAIFTATILSAQISVIRSGYCGTTENGADGKNLTWQLTSDSVLTISGTGEMDDYFYEKRPWDYLSFSSLIIKDGVTSIGKQAFFGFYKLKYVSIPESVTSICGYAFEQCSGLTYVKIPQGVTSIGLSAFFGCKNLSYISIPESVTSIYGFAFDETPFLNNKPDGLIYINNLLYKYKGIMPENTSIIIKEGTTKICDNAFFGCYGLTSITIPNSVTHLGEFAFSDCTGLTSITIPESVTSIGFLCFSSCPNLKINYIKK